MSTPLPPPPTPMTMPLPVEKVGAIRENEEDGDWMHALTTPSNHKFISCLNVCVCVSICTTLWFSILYFWLLLYSALIPTESHPLHSAACECFAYVRCSSLINNTKVLSSRFVSLSHFPFPFNSLIYIYGVLTAEYSAFTVQLFSCCVCDSMLVRTTNMPLCFLIRPTQ